MCASENFLTLFDPKTFVSSSHFVSENCTTAKTKKIDVPWVQILLWHLFIVVKVHPTWQQTDKAIYWHWMTWPRQRYRWHHHHQHHHHDNNHNIGCVCHRSCQNKQSQTDFSRVRLIVTISLDDVNQFYIIFRISILGTYALPEPSLLIQSKLHTWCLVTVMSAYSMQVAIIQSFVYK